MKFTHFAILTASVISAFAQLPTQKVLTVDLAQTIAQEAMMKCRADGYKVSVTVVDHTNLLKASRATAKIGKATRILARAGRGKPPVAGDAV